MNLRVLVQIILLSTLACGQKFQCPFYEELNGCKCYPKSQSLICNEKATDFPDIPQETYHFKTITLTSTNFSKKIDLHSSTVETLILINNHEVSIVNIKIPLINLHIAGENNLNFTELFSKLTISNILNITGQNAKNFQDLDTTIFESLKTVKKLYLKNNSITKVSGAELTKLPDLDEINLSNNKINHFDKDSLLFLSGKIQVDLSHNEINLTVLDTSNLLKSTADLEAVYLSFNNISTLKRPTFDGLLNKSDVIFIDNNPLNCNKSDVKWVFNKAENWQRFLRQAYCVDIKRDLFSSESILNPPTPTTITLKSTTTSAISSQTQTTSIHDTIPSNETTSSTTTSPTTNDTLPSNETSTITTPLTSTTNDTLPLNETSTITTPLSSTTNDTLPLNETSTTTTPLSSTTNDTLPLNETSTITTPLSSTKNDTLPLNETSTTTTPLSSTTNHTIPSNKTFEQPVQYLL